MEKISSSLKEIKIAAVKKDERVKRSGFSHRLSQTMLFDHLDHCSPVEKLVWQTYYVYEHYDKKKSWLSFQQVANLNRVSRSTVILATKSLVAKKLLLQRKEGQIIYYQVL